MPIRTKNVRDPAEAADGFRLLVMRYWPRGISKERAHGWERALSPSPDLIKAYRGGKIGWAEFARRYRAEMRGQTEALAALRARARRGTVTLLCGCPDESRCHRTLLARLVTPQVMRGAKR